MYCTSMSLGYFTIGILIKVVSHDSMRKIALNRALVNIKNKDLKSAFNLQAILRLNSFRVTINCVEIVVPECACPEDK